jgi:hypothetical protein
LVDGGISPNIKSKTDKNKFQNVDRVQKLVSC